MKTLTVRLPEALVAEIEPESRGRKRSKSDVVREQLGGAARSPRARSSPLDAVADLIGSVDGLPVDFERPQETIPSEDGLRPETSSLTPAFWSPC